MYMYMYVELNYSYIITSYLYKKEYSNSINSFVYRFKYVQWLWELPRLVCPYLALTGCVHTLAIQLLHGMCRISLPLFKILACYTIRQINDVRQWKQITNNF